MNNRIFPEHGFINLSVRDRFLVIEGEGPWNFEMAQRYREEVAPLREKLIGAPWASLVILHGLPLYPPEAKSFTIETVKQGMDNTGLVATGLVFKDVQYENAIKLFWEEIYKEAGLPYFFSDNEEDVTLWLNKQIEAAKK